MDYTKQAKILMLIGVAFGFAGLAIGSIQIPNITSLRAVALDWLAPEPPILVPPPVPTQTAIDPAPQQAAPAPVMATPVVIVPAPQVVPVLAPAPTPAAAPKAKTKTQRTETTELGGIPGLPRMPVQTRHIQSDAGGGEIVTVPPRRYQPVQPPSGSGKAVDDFLN